jgi:hypothetical protein
MNTDDNIELKDSDIAKFRVTDVESLIFTLIDKHRRNWSLVCEAYAPLKTAMADRN